MKKGIFFFSSLFVFISQLWSQQNIISWSIGYNVPAANLLSTKAVVNKLQTDIPVLMQKADIPGFTIAYIKDGQLVYVGGFGVMKANTEMKVTANTIFEAASLSKCVFTYGVLKLVDEGKLSLDTPLNKYLGNNYDVIDDSRINLITARMVLTHSAGFPNWRSGDSRGLPILFTPGSKFSYSGEGMVYLSRVVEKITGMKLEDYMQQHVLKPLKMNSSSYIWQDSYDTFKVYGHNALGSADEKWKPKGGHAEAVQNGANAAASMCTTATDYANFLVAVLNRVGLKKGTWDEMLRPQIRVDSLYPQVAWGLGVGMETMPEANYIWHWGDNGDAKAYYTAYLKTKDAVVYFANSNNGLSITSEILEDALGGKHPALSHLNYPKYNSQERMLLKATVAKGAVSALSDYTAHRSTKISEDDLNDMGYMLMRINKLDDALEIFKQNTIDYPNSWNVWDSYAEANLNKGNKELAIKYYQKSIELNPANAAGKEKLKKLLEGK